MRPSPILTDLVLVGGGHSNIEVLRRLAMRPVSGARVTLISEHATSTYSGMLPGHVAGHYGADEIRIDLRKLAAAADARFFRARVVGLDPDERRLRLDGRPEVAYDLLSLNVGSTPNTRDVPGAADHAVPVKPIEGFLDRWSKAFEEIQAKAEAGSSSPKIGVVGGGAAGVEIALALRQRRAGGARARLALIEAGPEILPGIGNRARRELTTRIKAAGIDLHTGRAVASVDQTGVTLVDNTRLEFDMTVWATGASAPSWLAETGLATEVGGFLAVDADLRSISHGTVFAAGDAAAIRGTSLPRSGVYAVRQGVVLADNLRRELLGRPTRPFKPQRRFLRLIATGPRHAVATRGGLAISGNWAWRWKDWIDRRFMTRYVALPAMEGARTSEPIPALGDDPAALDMRCKGCGSKLGAKPLSEALARLASAHPAVAPAALDDAAILEPPNGKILLQSIDFFPAPISDPWIFGAIAANHCLGDLHAMGAAPWTALALAQVPAGAEAVQSEDLFQLLAGAAQVLETENVRLVGGHSIEGDEMGLGFTVNGLAEPGAINRKAGLGDGDVLILTKPLGTGALLAAEMRGQAKARWIDGAIEAMLRGCGPAARRLAAHGATAMTDITGFGLAGHLAEMLRAGECDAELVTDAIPRLDGLEDVLKRGIESSLAPRNRRRALDHLAAPEQWSAEILGLLSDPQTAGGLLAGVPADRAEACLAALRAGGDDARIIGRALPRQGATAMIHMSDDQLSRPSAPIPGARSASTGA